MTQKQLAIPLALILIISIGYVAADTVVNENPDGYDLDVSTEEPVDVRPTEATFVAEVTELDDIYDAALIYWNYTDGENEYKGPANLATSEGETVESYQPNLDADTGYDVEAYAEPVVWDDDTLVDNWAEKGLDEERELLDAFPADDADAMSVVADSSVAMEAVADSSVAMEAVADSSVAMEAVADSSVAMDAVADSEPAMDAVFSSAIASEAVWDDSELVGLLYESDRHGNFVVDGDGVDEETGDSYSVENRLGGVPLIWDGPGDNDNWDDYPVAEIQVDASDYDSMILHFASSAGVDFGVRVGSEGSGDQVFSDVSGDYGSSEELSNAVSGGELEWREVEIDLSGESGSIYLGNDGGTFDGDWWAVSDIVFE